ncbi:MAG TPA: TrkH family potassium uptake protein [Candidatus Limnocylindrales bacterium]|nr:TrkH family potassium uptake protein [Candidatus Limnocylindrales bacterium]
MRRFHIFHLIGVMLLFLALTMVISALWSVGGAGTDRLAFLKAILITAAAGGFLYWFFSGSHRRELSLAESFTLVTLAWFVAGIFGALPYHFYGLFGGNFVDAFFESVSGFTTTGATVIVDIESVPRGLLLWRSFTQWLGGMGIIVLFLAILPRYGFRSMTMFKAELPGPIAERVVPRVVETARRFWLIYVAFTVLQILLLLLSGISFFDALAHSLTTMPTGGFSTYNASIAALANPMAEIVIIFFMFFAGVNFVIYFRLLCGDFKVLKNSELKFYTALIIAATVLVSVNISQSDGGTVLQTLRQGAFHVVSITTTTGYTTADFDSWPTFSRLILLVLMFIGACGGSTGGAIKQVRLLMMIKFAFRELYRTIHPSAIVSVKLGDLSIAEDVMRAVMGFGFLYLFFTTLATLALSAMGLDFETALSAVASSFGNVGPGMGLVGPLHTYQVVPSAGKMLLSVMMIIGRLEIYTVLVLFLPESRRLWKNAFKADG